MTNLSFSRVGKWLATAGIAASITVGAVAAAQAQEISPEVMDLALKYANLTDQQGIYEGTLVGMAARTSKLLSQQNPEISDKIDAAIKKVLEQYKGKRDDLFKQFALVYATTFTADELQQILAFYATPVGKKLLEESQHINDGITATLRVYVNNLGTEFLAKVRAELKAQGYNL